nr:hypothetical protein [Tanacetum cinerariifolium]
MMCPVPHTSDEIKALVEKQIEEDKARQLAIMNLAVEYGNASGAKDDLRKAYEKCNHIQQETRALIDTFLKEGSNKDYEMHNSLFGKVAIIKKQINAKLVWLWEKYKYRSQTYIEEKAMEEKAREEKIKQKQADDEEFFLEFRVNILETLSNARTKLAAKRYAH